MDEVMQELKEGAGILWQPVTGGLLLLLKNGARSETLLTQNVFLKIKDELHHEKTSTGYPYFNGKCIWFTLKEE